MKNQRLVYILCILAAAVLLGGCQSKRPDAFRYKVDLVSDVKIAIFPNSDYKKSQMELDYRILDVDDQGVSHVQLIINTLKADMTSMKFKFAFDGDTHNDLDPQAPLEQGDDRREQRFLQHFAGLQGVSYGARIDRDGQVLELIDIDPRLAAVEKLRCDGVSAMLGCDQVQMLLAEASLKEYAQLAFASSTPDPVERPVRLPNINGPLSVVDTFSEEGTEERNGDKVNRYALNVVEQEGSKPKRSGQGLSVKDVKGTGQLLTSPKNGNVVYRQEKLVMQMQHGQAAGGQSERGIKVFLVIEKTIEDITQQPALQEGDS